VRGLLPDKEELIPGVGVPAGARLKQQWIATGTSNETEATKFLHEVELGKQKWEWGIPFPWHNYIKRNKKDGKDEHDSHSQDGGSAANTVAGGLVMGEYRSLFADAARTVTLREAWDCYVADARKRLESSTMRRKLAGMSQVMESIGDCPIDSDLPWTAWNYLDTEYGAKRRDALLGELSLACDYAWSMGLAQSNPFGEAYWVREGRAIKKPKKEPQKQEMPRPFTAKERDTIIKAYPTVQSLVQYQHSLVATDRRNRYVMTVRDGLRHRRITPFTKLASATVFGLLTQFGLLTGARVGEILALTWDCINLSERTLLFNKVAGVGESSISILKHCLKTQRQRFFPINNQLYELLLLLLQCKTFLTEQAEVTLNDCPLTESEWTKLHERYQGLSPIEQCQSKFHVVFPSVLGRHLFIQRSALFKQWKDTIRPLGIDPRSPYNLRHTFISQCLDKGVPVTDVAQWVGNSPAIIYRHYAGILSNKNVPDL
jgi:integrase